MKPPFFSSTHKLPSMALLAGFFFFSAAVSRADDLELESDPALAASVTNLAVGFASSLRASSSNATDDDVWKENIRFLVNGISTILNNAKMANNGIRSVPYATGASNSSTLGAYLAWGLYSDYPGLTTSPSSVRNSSYLKIIRDLIRDVSGPLTNALYDAATGDPYLGQFTFTSDWRARVYDEEVDASVDYAASQISGAVNDAASNLQSDLHGAIDDAASSVSGSLGDLADDLTAYLYQIESYINNWYSDWRDVRETAEDYDDETDNTVSSAEDDVERDEANTDEQVEEAYELEGLPEAPYQYEPEVDIEELDGQDLGLSSLSGASDHNALITLVSRSDAQRGPIPQIEVDFGANDELVDGAGRIAGFLAWMYRTLGALFLGLKGVHMWRVCYTSTVLAATGNDPTVQLAWNPF